MQRRKGATAERELCRLLSEHLGEDVVRNLSQSRDGGHDLLGVGRFALEVKRCEKLTLGVWWVQACRQAEEVGLLPALAYRQSRQPWRFIVPLSTIAESDVIGTLDIENFVKVIRGAGMS